MLLVGLSAKTVRDLGKASRRLPENMSSISRTALLRMCLRGSKKQQTHGQTEGEGQTQGETVRVGHVRSRDRHTHVVRQRWSGSTGSQPPSHRRLLNRQSPADPRDEGRQSALNMHYCNSTPMRLLPLFVLLRDSFPAGVKRDTNISGA
ncbi:hypothetical protein E2C01_022499 [Portunus trituberculatus]|uniref:Uncharacterized protein n=1 Tax=Portunus trituberculatus TaxID=210409 RepID=A0A5B7E7W0_PORTR|nr:hypothetical protein [Portunus trituberculatus]